MLVLDRDVDPGGHSSLRTRGRTQSEALGIAQSEPRLSMIANVSVAGDKFASVEDLHRTHALKRSGKPESPVDCCCPPETPWRC